MPHRPAIQITLLAVARNGKNHTWVTRSERAYSRDDR